MSGLPCATTAKASMPTRCRGSSSRSTPPTTPRARGSVSRSRASSQSGWPGACGCTRPPGRRCSRLTSRRSLSTEPIAGPELVLELAQLLRERVLPELGSHAGRAHEGGGAGGDVTFAVDALAEESLDQFVAERSTRLAFYSEGRGLVATPGASHVLVVDPIDGTRPAMAGLESACVAVALAPLGDGEPTMADIQVGCVVEIKSGEWFR